MKKYSFYLTAALSLFIHGTISNLSASGQEIVVEFDPKVAIVKTFEQPKYGLTNNFQWGIISTTQKVLVEPISKDILLNVSSEGKNKIVITKENGTFLNTDLISEKILNVEEKKKPLQAKGDITHLSVIDHKEALFRFHNDGYLHTASSHGYVNCCFESEKKGAGVTLSGKSSQLDQSTPTTFRENLSKNISQEINNNLSNPVDFHKPITNGHVKFQVHNFHAEFSKDLTGSVPYWK